MIKQMNQQTFNFSYNKTQQNKCLQWNIQKIYEIKRE